jgi:hypothetical protein
MRGNRPQLLANDESCSKEAEHQERQKHQIEPEEPARLSLHSSGIHLKAGKA